MAKFKGCITREMIGLHNQTAPPYWNEAVDRNETVSEFMYTRWQCFSSVTPSDWSWVWVEVQYVQWLFVRGKMCMPGPVYCCAWTSRTSWETSCKVGKQWCHSHSYLMTVPLKRLKILSGIIVRRRDDPRLNLNKVLFLSGEFLSLLLFQVKTC